MGRNPALVLIGSRSVLANGNSSCFTVPQEVLADMDLSVGDSATMLYDRAEKELIIKDDADVFSESVREALLALSRPHNRPTRADSHRSDSAHRTPARRFRGRTPGSYIRAVANAAFVYSRPPTFGRVRRLDRHSSIAGDEPTRQDPPPLRSHSLVQDTRWRPPRRRSRFCREAAHGRSRGRTPGS
jgi:hypothetical protein